MQDYQQRVIDELSELNIKRDKLRKFIMNLKEFNGLSSPDQGLLISQQQIMGQYADILNRRIKAFE